MKRGKAVPHDRVSVDLGAVHRVQLIESFLVPALLPGQLAQLAVDEGPRLRGRAFEHDAGRLVDLGQAGAEGRLLASRIESLSRDLLVDVLAEEPLTFAGEQDLEAILDRVEKKLFQRIAAQQVLLAGRGSLHDPRAAAVIERLDLRAVLAMFRTVDRPSLVVLAAAPAGDQAAQEERGTQALARADVAEANAVPARLHQLLSALKLGGRDQRLVGVGNDDPVAGIVLARLVGVHP